jgi:superfamily II DNA or RNA helicase
MKIIATIGSEICLNRWSIPYDMLQALERKLSRANPAKKQKERLGFSVYGEPDRVVMMTTQRNEVRLPRGALGVLRDTAKKFGVDLGFESSVCTNVLKKRSLDGLPVTLRSYQKQAISQMLQRVQGYVMLPCGGGKTVLGAGAIYASGESALVLVHTHELMEQWDSAFRNLYGVRIKRAESPWRPLKAGEVAIGMVQKLHRAGDAPKNLYNSVGAVLVDECHHVTAVTFREIMEKIPSRHRWGLTATPERADGWTFLLPLLMGPQLFSMTTRDLVEAGHLVDPVILPVLTGTVVGMNKTKTGRFNMPKAVSDLCEDKDRTDFISQLIVMGARKGRRILVLVPRIKMAHSMAFALSEIGVGAIAITGSVNKATRERFMHSFKTGTTQVAIATQLADEGLDVPALDLLIVASAGRASGRAVQRIGRAMRLHKDKSDPIVVDLVDGGLFMSQWRAREKAYFEQLGILVSQPLSKDKGLEVLSRLLVGDALPPKKQSFTIC